MSHILSANGILENRGFGTGSKYTSVVSRKQLELFFLIFRGFPFADSWSSAARLDLLQGLFAPAEFLNDRLDRRCPDQGFGVGIPASKEFIDRSFEVINTDKDTPANTFASQFPEPTLDQIQPA